MNAANRSDRSADLQEATDLKASIRTNRLTKRHHRSVSPVRGGSHLHARSWRNAPVRSRSPGLPLVSPGELPMPRMASTGSTGSTWSSLSNADDNRSRFSSRSLLTSTDDEAIEEMDTRIKSRKPSDHRHIKDLLLKKSHDLDLAFEKARDIEREIDEDHGLKYTVRLQRRIKHAHRQVSRTPSPTLRDDFVGAELIIGSGHEEDEHKTSVAKRLMQAAKKTKEIVEHEKEEEELFKAARENLRKNHDAELALKKQKRKKKHHKKAVEKVNEQTNTDKHKKKTPRGERSRDTSHR